MAEQTEPVRRRVALKIIKPGMDSRQVVARFEAERQALAMMDHQNIAKVLDAGTTGEVEGGGWREETKMRLPLPPPATHHAFGPPVLRHGADSRRGEKKCKGSFSRTHQRKLKRRFTSYVKSAVSRVI
jgi:hypothetical protein